MADPVLHLIAGPNGAGKSTLYDAVIFPITNLPFINADDIARRRWLDQACEHAYEAAELANQERLQRIAQRQSFVTETVFSHESKIDLVRTATHNGYLTTLHIVMIPEELAVVRVGIRVAEGGHGVPEEKIRSRFKRLWALLADAIELVDKAIVYDNSKAGTPFREVLGFQDGHLLGSPEWPSWTPDVLRRAGTSTS